MTSARMYWIRLAGGVLVLLVGFLWALQGAGVIGGSGMSGQTQWLLIGAVLIVIGLWLLWAGVRRRQA